MNEGQAARQAALCFVRDEYAILKPDEVRRNPVAQRIETTIANAMNVLGMMYDDARAIAMECVANSHVVSILNLSSDAIGRIGQHDPAGLLSARERDYGVLFCCFHTGLYFAPFKRILESQPDCVLSVGTRGLQESERQKMLSAITVDLGERAKQVEFHNITSRAGLMALARSMKRGRTATFMDAPLTDHDGLAATAHLIDVPFFRSTLSRPVSLLEFAYAVRAKVIYSWSQPMPDGGELAHFVEAPAPNGHDDRESWAGQALREAFRTLEVVVRQAPAQWEGLQYVHRMIQPRRSTSGDGSPSELLEIAARLERGHRITLPITQYCLLANADRVMLFERASYRVLPLVERHQKSLCVAA